MTIEDQPPPVPNDARPSWELVVDDMQERDRVGRERYGTPLQVGNGRNNLVDAYQEGLDQVVYLRTAIEERARALEALDRVISDLKRNGWSDWPKILEDQVRPALA